MNVVEEPKVIVISQATIKCMVTKCTEAADRLEAIHAPDWFAVAQAAATLEALRLGLAEVEGTVR